MTAAPASTAAAYTALLVRLEVAWTVSCRALGTTQGYQSAVLHAEFTWEGEPEAWHFARSTVALESGAHTNPVDVAPPVRARVKLRGAWAHLEVRSGDLPLLVASFEHGRMAYCVGGLPALAGLRGGTYDSPTGLLDAMSVTGGNSHDPGGPSAAPPR